MIPDPSESGEERPLNSLELLPMVQVSFSQMEERKVTVTSLVSCRSCAVETSVTGSLLPKLVERISPMRLH